MRGSLPSAAGSFPTGANSIPTAGVTSDGGGNIVPPGVAALVWEYVPGKFLPSDNLDARSGLVVGGLVDGVLYGSGRIVNVAFTSDGGAPIGGQTCWLASSQDDSNTGRGKATATQPTTVMPVFPLYTQNIVPVGTVVNASRYGIDGTATVRLTVPTAPSFTPVVDQTFNLHRAKLADTHRDGTLGETSWQPGESLFIAFTRDQIADDPTNFVLYNIGSGTGWSINCGTAVSIVNQGVALKVLGSPRPGLNIVCCTRTGGTFRGSLNGLPVETMADAGASPGASPTFGTAYTNGGLTAVVKLTRVLTDLELASFSSWNSLIRYLSTDAPTNFFSPPPTLITDLNCQWYLDLTPYTGGAIATTGGPAGTGFPMTNFTAPVVTAFSYIWNRNPQSLYLDGPPPSYDSKHLSRDRQLQRIAWSAATIFDVSMIVAAVSLDDTDNGDEGGVVVKLTGANGVEQLGVFGTPEDGVSYFLDFWSPSAIGNTGPLDILATMTAPYHVELICADKITRIDTFDSGAAIGSVVYPTSVTLETSATAKRLVVLGDGETYGGHSADLPSGAIGGGAVVTRVRADYPGRVSAFGVQATQSIQKITAWGNGTPLPYADYVFLYAHEGAPAAVVYLLAFGFMDWFSNPAFTVGVWSSAYQAFIDRLHTLDGAASFAIAKPVQTALYATPNFNAQTLQQFADEVAAIAATRPWLTLVDLTAPNTITFSGSPLAINPDVPAGQIALKENIKAAPSPVGYP